MDVCPQLFHFSQVFRLQLCILYCTVSLIYKKVGNFIKGSKRWDLSLLFTRRKEYKIKIFSSFDVHNKGTDLFSLNPHISVGGGNLCILLEWCDNQNCLWLVLLSVISYCRNLMTCYIICYPTLVPNNQRQSVFKDKLYL